MFLDLGNSLWPRTPSNRSRPPTIFSDEKKPSRNNRSSRSKPSLGTCTSTRCQSQRTLFFVTDAPGYYIRICPLQLSLINIIITHEDWLNEERLECGRVHWSEREGGRVFFRGMTGALAPFSYLVFIGYARDYLGRWRSILTLKCSRCCILPTVWLTMKKFYYLDSRTKIWPRSSTRRSCLQPPLRSACSTRCHIFMKPYFFI
jgi:hypothetical protein